MGKIIAISNQKGGVGKTTTAINVSSGLAKLGKKVLLVDFDAQGNASQGLGAITGPGQPTVYAVLMDDYPIEKTIVHDQKSKVDILPANISLAGADLMMDKMGAGKETILKKVLEPVKDKYDYILIDCPPSLGLLTTNALTAADSVLIPVQCEYYAL
ncbi:MAG TPA: sporulation initiation inhibitor Soj, partial [Erysipelotrichaceae bacterium]|nr:sporulation initiation inhibitor Soj [Erysipelotrichaceae bacterium]